MLQQAARGLRVEQVHIGVAGQAGGFLDDRLGGTELADVGAEQDDQVFLGDHPALGQGQQAGCSVSGRRRWRSCHCAARRAREVDSR